MGGGQGPEHCQGEDYPEVNIDGRSAAGTMSMSSDTQGTTERVIYVERSKEPVGWSVERKIPLAFLLALVAQAAGLVYYGAQNSFTMSDYGRRIVALEAKTDEHSRQINSLLLDVTSRLARIEARIQVQSSTP